MRYEYEAVDVQGVAVKKYIEAVDEHDARKKLLLANLDVKSVVEKPSLLHREFSLKQKAVKPVDILHFTRQMGAFIAAGLSIVDGLDIISRTTTNPTLSDILVKVRDEVREGTPFEDALAMHQKILPRYYIGVVRSASLTGRLDEALNQLAYYMERELEAKQRIRSALAYPTVILSMAAVSVVILTVWVLPKFVDLFEELDAKLPITTRMMIGLAKFSKNFWWVYVLLIALVVGVVVWFRTTPDGKRLRDRMVMRIPVISDVVLYGGVERVCRILSTLWKAGVPVADAMTAAVQSADNSVFEERLMPVHEAVLAGEGLAEPLAASELFPDAAVQMIAVGEASGTLAEQLENAADFYGKELEYKLKRLTTYFEPAVIIIVGCVVGFVALSLVQAMYGSLNGAK